MSIEAKQLMLKKLEKEFNNTLSATTTDNILKTIADQLDLYSLEPIGESDLDIISNDMLDSFLTAKQLEGRSEKTLERYKYIISKLLVFTKTPVRSLCHEITHAAMFSYNVSLTLEQEEIIADIISTYGEEIVYITNKVFNKLSNMN